MGLRQHECWFGASLANRLGHAQERCPVIGGPMPSLGCAAPGLPICAGEARWRMI